jgi:diguanylate cyclase (GGDEF)-like protein
LSRNPVDAALAEAAEDIFGETIDRLSDEVAAAERIISEQRARIAELERQATTDPLTGVANRRGFEAAFTRVLSRAKREDDGGVVIFVDLDGFKGINDTHGHDAGDAVLREVTRILRAGARDFDVVARLGGDEFVVVLVGAEVAIGRRRAEELYHRINGTTVAWQEHKILIRASFGIETFDGDSDRDVVLSHADAAMYRAKHGDTDGAFDAAAA